MARDKNFFYRVNPCEVLAEVCFEENKEAWFMQFFSDLKNDDPEKAKLELSANIIREAHEFRAKRSIAGKASAQQKATNVKHMLKDVKHKVNKRQPEAVAVAVQKQKNKPSLPEQALRLSGLLAELILANIPLHTDLIEAKKEKTISRWADDIDKLNRIDGQSWDAIEQVINWCQKDSFWSKNILSGSKLRDKFSRLYINATPKKAEIAPPCGGNIPNLDLYRQAYQREKE